MTTSKRLAQLQATVAARTVAAAQSDSEEVQILKLTAKLARLNSPLAAKARVQTSLAKETTDKLQALNLACEEVVNSMPIYSARTRENRKWNPTRTQGLGNQITLLTGILTGIMYSATEHKMQMLELTQLPEDLIEATLEAFGSAAYYSRNYNTIVEEIPADAEAIKANIELINDILNTSIDTTRITQQRLDMRFEVARLRAQRDSLDAANVETLTDSKLVI